MASTAGHEHVDRLTIVCDLAGDRPAVWLAVLRDQGLRWSEVLGEGAVVRITERLPEADLSGSHVARTMSPEAPFDITLSIWAPSIDVAKLAWSPSAEKYIAERKDRIAVALGWQCHFFGKTDAYVLHTELQRRQGMSHEDMSEYWHSVHTALGAYPRFRGYHQYHVEAAPTQAASLALGVHGLQADGITEPYFDDHDHLQDSMTDPRMTVPAADEPNFLDSAACRYAFSRVEYPAT